MTTTTETQLKITKVIPAPRAAVFAAWTEPEQIRQWSCPPDATVSDSQVDLKVGGAFRLRMTGEEMATHTAFGTYQVVEPPEKLVYTWDWEEETHAVGDTLVTVEFNDLGDSTEVVVTHTGFPNAEATEGHTMGWNGCLAQLEALLS